MRILRSLQNTASHLPRPELLLGFVTMQSVNSEDAWQPRTLHRVLMSRWDRISDFAPYLSLRVVRLLVMKNMHSAAHHAKTSATTEPRMIISSTLTQHCLFLRPLLRNWRFGNPVQAACPLSISSR